MVQGRAQLEHSNHIVGVPTTCWHFMSRHTLKEITKPAGAFKTMPQEQQHPGKGN